MGWQYYTLKNEEQRFHSLDQIAQNLALNAKAKDKELKDKQLLEEKKSGKKDKKLLEQKKSLSESFKMRETVAYGLERFWGEHLRLEEKQPVKSQYWKKTWDALVGVMQSSGITIPNDTVDVDRPNDVKAMAKKLWSLSRDDQRIALAVLTQLCDCLVWWTQRYKGATDLDSDYE